MTVAGEHRLSHRSCSAPTVLDGQQHVAALASAMTATDIAVTFAPVADSGGLGLSQVSYP